MKLQYSKPVARDLSGYRSLLVSGQWGGPPVPGFGGDAIDTCVTGSVATGPQTGASKCEAGAIVAGLDPKGHCIYGSVASVGDCTIGSGVVGCSNGSLVDTTCNVLGSSASASCDTGASAGGGTFCTVGYAN